jgi:hypothetical protein
MKNRLSSWSSFSLNFSTAPIELQCFFVFCTLATVFGFLILPFLSEDMKGNIIPVTGWNMAIPYAFNFVVLTSFFVRHGKTSARMNFQYGNILLVSIALVFGLYDLITWGGGYEGNTYLFRSPLRPLWTIALPIIWIVVLLSPRIKKYVLFLQSREPVI